MAHTVPFKLQKPAHEFEAGESIGFGIRCGIKVKNPSTRQDEWTNYEAAVFAKSPAAIEFYRANLIEGALVVVSGEKLLVKQYQGQPLNWQYKHCKVIRQQERASLQKRWPAIS